MPIVADAAVAVRGDLTPFNRDLKKADGTVQKLGKSMDTALNPKSLLLGAAGGAAIAGTISFLGDAVNAAGEFQDTVSASSVIFGKEYTPALQAWADEAHSAFGASKQDALEAADQMAIFGKSAGLMGDDLVDFATELTQLGGDLASFFGGRTEDAIGAVGSALRGEFEPIRRYGVLLDDATLKEAAMRQGIIKTTSEALTPQQKVLAVHAAILEQTSDAQGDFARTSDGLMNTQRDLTASWENLRIEIGERLIPVMLQLVNFAKDDVIPALQDMVGVIEGIAGPVIEMQRIVSDHLEEATGGVADFGDIWWTIVNPIGKVLEIITEDTEDAATSMTDTWAEAWSDIEVTTLEGGMLATRAVEAGGEDVVDATGEVMEGAIGEVEEGAEVIVGKFGEIPETGADAMLDEQWRLKDAASQLLEFMRQALSPLEEITQITGFLASKRLATALQSNIPLVRAKAEEMAAAAIARLMQLGPAGREAGQEFARQLGLGIDQFSYLAFQASARLAAGVSGFLPRSEPKNPDSALRGITTLGGDMVRMIADDMTRKIALAEAAAASLAGALNPTLGTPAMAGFGGGAVPVPVSMGSSAGNTYNITTASQPREKSTLEIAEEMRRAEYLNKLPGLDTHEQ